MMEDQRTRLMNFPTESTPADTIPSFLLKTYDILESQKYNDIICWTRNGEGFIVKKVKDFADSVLPIYFRHSNYTSFVRQLNMYDFHKTRQQNHENAFKNVMFKRGFKHLLKDIQRKDYKKNKENTKEAPAVLQKNQSQRPRQMPKLQKKYQIANDLARTNFNKIIQLSQHLEKKSLVLAEVRDISTEKENLLRLIDCLFDIKKIHLDIVDRMEYLGNTLIKTQPSASEIKKEILLLSDTKIQSEQGNNNGKVQQIPTCVTINPSVSQSVF